MQQTAWFSLARPLVLLHAALSIALVGASTHHLLVAYGLARGHGDHRRAQVHARTTGVAYVLTLLVGALAYPTYRYQVRALFLDRYEPWASNLFDIKENLATVGLPLALSAWCLSRFLGSDEGPPMRLGYLMMTGLTTAIVWSNAILGLLVTMVRSV